jgi:hypothetical protein
MHMLARADICNDGHSASSARVNVRIDNNATWMDAFQFGREGDTSWTLAGQTFELDVQLSPYGISLLSLTTANGRIITDDINLRVIHFLVAPADIQAALDPGWYVYDLVMVDGSGVRVPLMHGDLQVVQGVTYTAPG